MAASDLSPLNSCTAFQSSVQKNLETARPPPPAVRQKEREADLHPHPQQDGAGAHPLPEILLPRARLWSKPVVLAFLVFSSPLVTFINILLLSSPASHRAGFCWSGVGSRLWYFDQNSPGVLVLLTSQSWAPLFTLLLRERRFEIGMNHLHKSCSPSADASTGSKFQVLGP